MKWLKCGNDKNNTGEFFVPCGDDINDVQGRSVKNLYVREDAGDIRINFEDGAELRIFGSAMCPSFISSTNVQEHAPPPSKSEGAATEPLEAVAVSRLVVPSSSGERAKFELKNFNEMPAACVRGEALEPECMKSFHIGLFAGVRLVIEAMKEGQNMEDPSRLAACLGWTESPQTNQEESQSHPAEPESQAL